VNELNKFKREGVNTIIIIITNSLIQKILIALIVKIIYEEIKNRTNKLQS